MPNMSYPLKDDAGGTKFGCYWDPNTKAPAAPRALQRKTIAGEHYSWCGVGGGYEEINLLSAQDITDSWVGSGSEQIFEARGYNRLTVFMQHNAEGKNLTIRFYRRLTQTGTQDFLPAIEITGVPAGAQVRDTDLPATPFLKPEVEVEGGGQATVSLTVILSYGS